MDLRIRGRKNPSISADQQWREAWGLNDGSLVAADWKQALINAGYGWTHTIGGFSTPVAGGGAGTVIDQNQPEFGLGVPAGIAVIPLRFRISLVIPALATDLDECEALLAVDKDTTLPADGTMPAFVPNNMRMNSSRSVSCTYRNLATADITNPTLDIELEHTQITGDMNGTPGFAGLWTKEGLLYEPLHAPILYGPCALYAYWGGTAATLGKLIGSWLELPAELAEKLF